MSKVICPVCEKFIFTDYGEGCPVCRWQHDIVQESDPDFWAGPNIGYSLNSYRSRYNKTLKYGIMED